MVVLTAISIAGSFSVARLHFLTILSLTCAQFLPCRQCCTCVDFKDGKPIPLVLTGRVSFGVKNLTTLILRIPIVVFRYNYNLSARELYSLSLRHLLLYDAIALFITQGRHIFGKTGADIQLRCSVNQP